MRVLLIMAVGAAALWAVLSFGQARPIAVDNGDLPALALTDAAQASLAYSPASVPVVLQLRRAGVGNLNWPSSISRAVRAAERDRNDGGLSGGATLGTTAGGAPPPDPDAASPWRFELLTPWPDGGMRTQRLALDDRVFYFLMAGPGLERMPHFEPALTRGKEMFDERVRRDVVVVVEEGAGTAAASFVTEGEPRYVVQNASRGDGSPLWARYDGPASFAAVATEDGSAVIYRDRGGIFARRLVLTERGPTFGDRWRIAEAPDEIHHYQLVARADASGGVHLLWSLQPASEALGGNAHLTYCRLDALDGTGCVDLQVLSRTAAWQAVNLMIQEQRVYASWIDTRHTSGVWNRRNFAKLYVAASRDGGRSFGTPVTVNRPDDNADNALYALTAPAEAGGVLVFWTTRPVQGGWWERSPYHVGWLDRTLESFHLGRAIVPGQDISDRMEQATLRYHEELGRDAP